MILWRNMVMIDEKKLIEELHILRDVMNYEGAGEFQNGFVSGVDKAMFSIIEQPKIEDTYKWIPVEERLPEPSLNSVIGWDAYRERRVFVQYYMNDWILGNHESVKIVAWMPLPEPYVKGEEKNERL